MSKINELNKKKSVTLSWVKEKNVTLDQIKKKFPNTPVRIALGKMKEMGGK